MGEEKIIGSKSLSIKIPQEIGILPLRDTVIFPFMIVPLIVGREKSIKLINDCLAGQKIVGLIAQRKKEVEDPGLDELYRFGTVCKIHKMVRYPDQRVNIIVQGLRRFRLKQLVLEKPYLKAAITPLDDIIQTGMELEALSRSVSSQS